LTFFFRGDQPYFFTLAYFVDFIFFSRRRSFSSFDTSFTLSTVKCRTPWGEIRLILPLFLFSGVRIRPFFRLPSCDLCAGPLFFNQFVAAEASQTINFNPPPL